MAISRHTLGGSVGGPGGGVCDDASGCTLKQTTGLFCFFFVFLFFLRSSRNVSMEAPSSSGSSQPTASVATADARNTRRRARMMSRLLVSSSLMLEMAVAPAQSM